MSGISTEQWERRKWYLVRTLFEENPILSPIPETQEVSLEPTSHYETYISRPYSPLPDLIIEKEPNRHDEPEEYYQALEIKIRKLYRKLFIHAGNFPIISSENTYEDICHKFVDKTQSKSSEIKNNSVDVSPQSPKEDTLEQSEHEQLHDELQNSSISNDEHEVNKSRSNIEESMSACLSNASSLLALPEVMRKRQNSDDSDVSLSAIDVERHFSAEISTDKRLAVRDMEEAEFTSPEKSIILEFSTMKNQSHPQENRKRRFVSEMSICNSRYFGNKRKCDTVTTQTSFSESEDESKCEEIQKYFFEGTPRMFKLCSCTDHVCC